MATAIHQYEDKLLDFAYGELPAPEASAVESHVKSCPRCTQALEQIRGVRTTMASLPQVAPPDAGLESLLAYAEQAARRSTGAPRPSAPWWRRAVGPVAGAFALALVAVVAWRSQEEGIAPTKEMAALDATRKREAAPPMVAAAEAPAPQDLEQNAAQQMKTGKVAGGAQALNDRDAKENKNWDSLSKVTNELGATKAAEEKQQAQQQQMGELLKTASKESGTRRAVNQKDVAQLDQGYGAAEAKKKPADKMVRLEAAPEPKPVARKQAEFDSVNARGGGGREQEQAKADRQAPAEEPAQPQAAPPPPPKTAVPMGLSSAGPGSGTGGLGTNAPAAAPAPSKPAPVAIGSLSDGNSAPSLGVGLGTKSGGKPSKKSMRSNAVGGSEDFDQSFGDDVKGKEEVARRDTEQEMKNTLEAARAASNSGNLQEEAKLSKLVVDSNVRGSVRAEALSRLCTALEALGNEDAADRYCDLLLREFPNSAAAKQIADRRNRVQRAPAPKAASKPSADEYAREKAAEPSGKSPVKAKKADEQPAATSY